MHGFRLGLFPTVKTGSVFVLEVGVFLVDVAVFTISVPSCCFLVSFYFCSDLLLFYLFMLFLTYTVKYFTWRYLLKVELILPFENY